MNLREIRPNGEGKDGWFRIDRTIGITVILAMLGQAGTVIWRGAQLSYAVEGHEARIRAIEELQRSSFAQQLNQARIEADLRNLASRMDHWEKQR